MKTIDELWYGNVSPFEQCTRGDKRLKELLKLVAQNREELNGTLTDKQKETLEKFEDCMNEMHSITERDAFSYGFRLGVQLMAEAFILPLGEDHSLERSGRYRSDRYVQPKTDQSSSQSKGKMPGALSRGRA